MSASTRGDGRPRALTVLGAILTWRGRLARLPFLTGVVGTFALSALARAAPTLGAPGAVVAIAALPLVAYLLVALPVRRARDLGIGPARLLPAYAFASYLCWSFDEHDHLVHHPVLNLSQFAFLAVLACWPGRARPASVPGAANDP